MFEVPPLTKTILPPKHGWKESAYYIIDCAFSPHNPIHRYVFYTGFLNGKNKTPGGYNEIFRTEGRKITDCHYLKTIALIALADEYGVIKPVTSKE